MPSRYPLLDVNCESPPPDVAAEIPCPMLGADPAEKELTPRVAYLLNRIDGMTTLGDLLPAIPMAPKALLEALLLLHTEGLVGFSPEFETKYLKPTGPVRTSLPPGAPGVPAPPREVSSPPLGVSASLRDAPSSLSAPPREAPPIAPIQITKAPDAARPTMRQATFTIPPGASIPPSSPSSPGATRPPGKAPPAPTETLTPERHGDLSAKPPARLARHLTAARYTGVLTLKRGKATKRITFVGGEPAQADSDIPDEELGIMMHKRGKLDDKAFADYQARRKQGGTPLAALVEMGAVADIDAPRADRWRAQAVLFDALLWREGTYDLGEPGKVPADTPHYDLGLANLVIKAWREAPFEEKRKKFFDERRNWYLVLAAMSDDLVAKMKLNPKEERLLQALREQTRRVRDVFEITSLFITETYKFIDGLLAMGLAELTEKNPTEAGPVEVKELPSLFETMEAGNYFDRLSAHPISTDQDIVEAHDRMLSRFHPRHYFNLRQPTRELLEKMVAMIEEAYEKLKNGAERKAYRNKEYDRPRLEYFADIQFRKGEIFLFWRDDPRTAYTIFESSWEMCPDIPLYAASYALSAIRSFPADRKKTTEAKEVLERALARGAQQAKVLVIGAAAVRALGDIGRSEQLCNQALKVSGNSPDIAHLVEQVRRAAQEK